MAVTMMAFGLNSIVAYPVGALADRIGERPTIALLAATCLVVIAAGALALRYSPQPSPARAPAQEPDLSSRQS
jgi:MFS family permease